MKSIYVIDHDDRFMDTLQSISFVEKVDFKSFHSLKKFMQVFDAAVIDLIFLNISLPDSNEFIIYDLLKKSHESDSDTPIFFTYEAEGTLTEYQNMKFQPVEYLKKPVSMEKVRDIVLKNISLKTIDNQSITDGENEISDTFEKKTDSLFDDLMRKDLEDSGERNEKNHGIFTVHDGKIDQLEEEFDRIRSQKEELVKENQELHRQLKEMGQQDKTGVLQNMVDRLNQTIEEKDRNIQELKSMEESQRSFINTKNREIDKLSRANEKVQEQLENLKKDLVEKDRQIETLRQSLHKYKEISQKLKEIE